MAKETERAIFTAAIRDGYFEALEGTTEIISRIGTVIPTNSVKEVLGWTDFLGTVKKFTGERVLQKVADNKQTVILSEYQLSIDVPKRDLQAANYASHVAKAKSGGREIGLFPSKKVAEVYAKAQSTPAYDGKNLAANDHAWAGGTYDNLVGTQLSKASLTLAMAFLSGMPRANGEPGLNAGATFTLMTSPNKQVEAFELTRSILVNSGETNAIREMGLITDVLVNPYDTNDDHWSVFVNNGPVKPVAFLERTREDLEETYDSNTRTYYYDSYIDCEVTPTLWQLAYFGQP